jgi:hypothetical protein
MSNAFIGRKSAIWLWKETTAGTAVAAQVWIPKEGWILNPSFEEAVDSSWYGVIDEIYESYTTKNFSQITLTGIMRDDFIGYLLLGALWKYTKLYCVTGTPSGWTPVRWDVLTWNGAILKKIIKIGSTDYYFFDKSTSWSITNGTRTMTATAVNWVNAHFFERKNDNNHPSFTLYDDDPVAWAKAPYSMINSFEVSCEVADYVKFSAEFMWKKMQDSTGNNPVYTDDAPFLASMAGVKFAANETWLNTATEQCMQNFRLTINKNLVDLQCFGDDDVSEFHNQQLWVEWDFEALYSDTTLRDYVINSEKKALRFYAENHNVDALATGVYPAIYIDCMKVWMKERAKSDDNNWIVKQTMWFTAQYDNATSATIEILLLNWNSTGY